MVAAGAVARIVGPDGTRVAPVEEIPTGPGKTSLKKGELVDAIILPERGAPRLRATPICGSFPRTEMDIAVVGCGVSLTLDEDGTCTAARVVAGRGGADGFAGARSGGCAHWHQSGRCGARRAGGGLFGGGETD